MASNLLKLDIATRNQPNTLRLRRQWKRKTTVELAVLGKGDGNPPLLNARRNRVWIRRAVGEPDTFGNIQLGVPEQVYCRS